MVMRNVAQPSLCKRSIKYIRYDPIPGHAARAEWVPGSGKELTVKRLVGNRLMSRGPLLAVAAIVWMLGGCDVDSFFDPSVTGRFKHMPTTIPILERIDVVEQQDDLWSETVAVSTADLIPSDLVYRLSPNDLITVRIFELYRPDEWHISSGNIDAAGLFRIPEIGDIRAAGLTAQEFEDRVSRILDEQVIQDPLVDVVVEDGRGFQYTLYGSVETPGVYSLQRSDLRLLDALAIAGNVTLSTESIYVIRQIPLTDTVEPQYDSVLPPVAPDQPTDTSVDIDDLIKQLELEQTPDEPPADDDVSPGVLRQQGEPVVDIDDITPPTAPGETPAAPAPPVGVEASEGDTFIFDEQRGEWVRVRSDVRPLPTDDVAEETDIRPLTVERVIEIPFQRLKRGDTSLNIVIRPDDRIYVEEPWQGVVYLDGEVARPGVYNMPINGKLTLSRLIAAAGGFGPLAIPERVDLTRVVGDSREATVRLNLGAIRRRTEPDIYLKPDDHVIVGTNFWATPLAVLRNGFRVTYGFGFLLDRNFGNDVFGAPPTNFNN